jgi:hypothetical protein
MHKSVRVSILIKLVFFPYKKYKMMICMGMINIFEI